MYVKDNDKGLVRRKQPSKFLFKAFPGALQQCAGWTETVHTVHALHSIVVLQSVCFIQQWYNIVHIALL